LNALYARIGECCVQANRKRTEVKWMAVYVGIDVHKRFCQAALMDENGTHVNVQIGHYQEDERDRVLSIAFINSLSRPLS